MTGAWTCRETSATPPKPHPWAADVRPLQHGTTIAQVPVGKRGRLALTALVTLGSEAPAGSTALVEVALWVDKHRVDARAVEVSGKTGEVELALQGVVSIPAGSASIEIGHSARDYSSVGPGDAFVEAVSAIATLLPPTH